MNTAKPANEKSTSGGTGYDDHSNRQGKRKKKIKIKMGQGK